MSKLYMYNYIYMFSIFVFPSFRVDTLFLYIIKDVSNRLRARPTQPKYSLLMHVKVSICIF